MRSRQTLIGETMVTLADNLVTDFDVIELLTMLTDRCVTILDVSAAGLMLAGPDGLLRVIASSSEQMRLLELFELQNDQGPCLESFQTGEAVTVVDLSTATSRWPTFAPEAMASGFLSVHALPLRLRGTVIGALNLFDSDPEGIDEERLQAARAFADIATIAILQYRAAIESHELIDQLNTALNTRIVIEQAKGIIAERQHFDMERAFAALRQYARNNNLRLSDVATAVVTGSLKASSLTSARGAHVARGAGRPTTR
jgi:GAF domain-containing protein